MIQKFIFPLGVLSFLGAYVISYRYPFFYSLSLYGLVMFIYFAIQLVASWYNHKYYHLLAREKWLVENSQRKRDVEETGERISEEKFQCVLVVVGHRERKDYWQMCLDSILELNPQSLVKVYVIVDGQEDEDAYMKDMAELTLVGSVPFLLDILCLSKRGKRGAMFYAFEKIRSDFPGTEKTMEVVVTDSDTVLSENSILRLCECLRSHPNNGCATGLLQIYNLKDGLLPKMINARYQYAFIVERGATSWFGCMTCCSGPISIYKMELLHDLILKKFITQSFLTVRCEPGDDRHLTNLILAQGYWARQTNLAVASTEAPETWYRFLHQQLRWSRSYYRELYWQYKALPHQSYYLSFVMTYETLFPILVSTWIFFMLFVNTQEGNLIRGFGISLSILVVRTFVLYMYLKDYHMIYNLYYYPVYILLLLPTKIYALLSLLNNGWVTAPRANQKNKKSFCTFYFGFLYLWNLLLLTGFTRSILIANGYRLSELHVSA